ncbi:hypothetical protein CDD83_7066 [Cordyceps sp. RAO-2017]|nr:hypothetical protein CDD83_7066 [Cordyceps sp. RAO-2017]
MADLDAAAAADRQLRRRILRLSQRLFSPSRRSPLSALYSPAQHPSKDNHLLLRRASFRKGSSEYSLLSDGSPSSRGQFRASLGILGLFDRPHLLPQVQRVLGRSSGRGYVFKQLPASVVNTIKVVAGAASNRDDFYERDKYDHAVS